MVRRCLRAYTQEEATNSRETMTLTRFIVAANIGIYPHKSSRL